MHARRTGFFFCYARMYSGNSARLNKTEKEMKRNIFLEIVLFLIFRKFYYDSVYLLTLTLLLCEQVHIM